ncbi:MAG: hypothetical protein M3O91_02030 [Chloroflexota bacterium]|nr:hypothetical protein [Chloroflexota bacterium]
MTLVLLDVRDHEAKVCGDEALGGALVTLLRAPGESALFLGIAYERELLYVVEVLIESGGGRRTKEPFRPAFGHMLHTRPVFCGKVNERRGCSWKK